MKIFLFLSLSLLLSGPLWAQDGCAALFKNFFQDAYDSLAKVFSTEVKEAKVIESDLYISEELAGGKRRMTLKPGKKHNEFNGSGIFELALQQPEYAKRLGITLKVEEGKTFIEYPSIAELNKKIKALREAKDPYAPQFTFKLFEVKGEVPLMDFAESLARGEIPVTYTGTHYFHDLGVHTAGWAYLPKEVANSIQVRLKFLTEMAKRPGLERLQTNILAMIGEEIDALDFQSALLSSQIAKYKTAGGGSKNSLNYSVFMLGRGKNGLGLDDLAYSLKMTPQELEITKTVHPGSALQGPSMDAVDAILSKRPDL